MASNQYLIISAIGPDQVGLVHKISGFVAEHRANIEDSKMAVFCGEFAIIMLIAGDESSLGEIEAKLLRKLASVDFRRGYDDLVFLARARGLSSGNSIDSRDPVGIDLDADLARGRDVTEIRSEPIGNVDTRGGAPFRQSNGRLDSRYRIRKARAITLTRLLAGAPGTNCGSGATEPSGNVNRLPGLRART